MSSCDGDSWIATSNLVMRIPVTICMPRCLHSRQRRPCSQRSWEPQREKRRGGRGEAHACGRENVTPQRPLRRREMGRLLEEFSQHGKDARLRRCLHSRAHARIRNTLNFWADMTTCAERSKMDGGRTGGRRERHWQAQLKGLALSEE